MLSFKLIDRQPVETHEPSCSMEYTEYLWSTPEYTLETQELSPNLWLCYIYTFQRSIHIGEIRPSLAVRPQQECDIIVDPTRREPPKLLNSKADN